jgi:signal transduction histidine kinase
MGLIKGYLEMIQDTSIGTLNEKQKEFLNIAKENTDRLSRLINDVLDFQKLESGRIEFRMAKADINQLIEAVANNCQPLARAKSIKLNLILEKGIPEINFDKDRITQVLTNLINNAVKFTDQGSVEISTKRLENAVRVAIKDTGIGIKKEDLPRLFESFSQVGKNYDDKDRGGTGLDLAISQKIIQEHRGKMEVESEFQKGSSFSFYLPIVERRQ